MSVQRINPYVGPRPFFEGELLYGRDTELNQLLYRLVTERILLFLSPPGAGKTSLIQAGLIPLLKQEDFLVLPVIRVNLELSPEDGLTIPKANRYIISMFLSIEESLPSGQSKSIEELAGLTIKEYLDQYPWNSEDSLKSVALVFDQFEEILTQVPEKIDYAQKYEFFEQLGDALKDEKYWAMFSMREETTFALLNYFELLPNPNIFSSAYRLDYLGEEATKQVIQQPARNYGIDFLDETAHALVDDLRSTRIQMLDGSFMSQLGKNIEPLSLQLVLFRLWNSLPEGTTEITYDHLRTVGDTDLIISNFYADEVARVAVMANVKESVIRSWFQYQLISPQGFRLNVFRGQTKSGGLDNQIISQLENSKLIRSERLGGAVWFSLASDNLIGPIRKDNDEWFNRNVSPYQKQATLWEQAGRPDFLLASGEVLLIGEQEAAEGKFTDFEMDYLQASRQSQLLVKMQSRRDKTLFAILWLVLGILGGSGLFLLFSSLHLFGL